MEQKAVIVIGMYRSGTSAVSGMLAELGVFMGSALFAPQKGVNEVRNRQISQRSIDLSEQNFEKIFFEGPDIFSNFGRFLEINSRGGL